MVRFNQDIRFEIVILPKITISSSWLRGSGFLTPGGVIGAVSGSRNQSLPVGFGPRGRALAACFCGRRRGRSGRRGRDPAGAQAVFVFLLEEEG